jgi:hypothetical protein
MIDFSFEKRKNFLFNPILSFLRVYFRPISLLASSRASAFFFYDTGLNRKFLRFSDEKSVIFKNIFTIFNQLYNFHCLHNLCNGKINIKMA